MPSSALEGEATAGRLGTLRARYEPQLAKLRSSDTAKAAGLAGAMIVNNVVALVSTVVFARLLSDYASLAALVSYFLILSVGGQAIQVATAREGVLGHLGVGAGLTATLRRWTRSIVIVTVALTVVSVLLREQIAQAVGVKHDPWAAAIGLPAGCLWLELSILRGALQGVGDYKSVGLSLIAEQSVRLVSGALLAAIGLGVTGAYLGTPISFIAISLYCGVQLRRYVAQSEAAPVAVGVGVSAPATAASAPATAVSASASAASAPASAASAPASAASARAAAASAPADANAPPAAPAAPATGATIALWTHVRRAWAPIAGLIVIAVLQNIDIIAAKHRFNGVRDLASSYAATAVAAKVLIWVAVGAGFYLVPEVSRRRSAGEDTRPVLAKAVGIILVCAVPVLLIFAFGATPLLRAAFGSNRLKASDSLFMLGVAFTVLATTYLAIQYMLALKRTRFLILLGVVAVAEPVLLLQASRQPTGFAAVVLAVQAVGAVLAFGLALRRERPSPGPGGAPAGSGRATQLATAEREFAGVETA